MFCGSVIPRSTSSIGKPVFRGAGAAVTATGLSPSIIVRGASGFSAVPVMSDGGGSSVIWTVAPSLPAGIALSAAPVAPAPPVAAGAFAPAAGAFAPAAAGAFARAAGGVAASLVGAGAVVGAVVGAVAPLSFAGASGPLG